MMHTIDVLFICYWACMSLTAFLVGSEVKMRY